MPRPREYSDDLRQQLLDTAARLLATEGPEALSTRRIASKVGTSTTAIYRLIGSKGELVRQLYLEGFRRLSEHLADVPVTDEPMADLAALAAAYHQSAIDSPFLYDMMFGSPVPGFVPTPDDATYALGTLRVLIDAIARAVDAGEIHGDPDALAHELWAVCHGVTSLELRGMMGDPPDAQAHLDAVLARAITGYRAHGARG